MSDTVKIEIPRNIWTNISLAEANGLVTNNRRNSMRFRQAIAQPDADSNFGHVLQPGESTYFYLNGGQKIWARPTSDVAGVVAVTGGLALTKDGVFNRDFIAEVNAGNIPGYDLDHKFGFNSAVSTALEHIWNHSADLIWQTVATKYEILSGDSTDNASGVGARSIFIEALLTDFTTEIVEVAMHATDGTIAVPTTNSYIRCQRAWVGDVGTYGGNNVGLITIRQLSAGNVQTIIDAGIGQSQKTQYTVPAGKTGYLRRASMTVETVQVTTVHLHKRESADIVVAPFTGNRIMHQWNGLAAPFTENFRANHVVAEKSDIWFEGKTVVGPGTVDINSEILLIDN